MTKVRTSAIIKKMAIAAKTNSHRVHVTTRGTASWAIKKEGNIKASNTYTTLEEAIDAAKTLVEKGQASKVVVHNKEGKIVQSGV
ncbi:DUF2188 domain-containing protein [Winogradskyella forsetii]|uniref:DUF2188 domain-containing protein n=1 Tax=Winogradskyella forsetii TaxID=2686077 RepID=UPI0015C160EA|nr:DUF2188 domain-containing protein [Winogradskyella forsetii]